jgi:hypothetical protein
VSPLVTAPGVTATGPGDAARAPRFVPRHRGPDAAAVLAILGPDKAAAPARARTVSLPGAAPDHCRRTTTGNGRRRR